MRSAIAALAAVIVTGGIAAFAQEAITSAPHEFMRFEVWASAAALEAHKQSPHLRASFEKRQREGWTTQILTWDSVSE